MCIAQAQDGTDGRAALPFFVRPDGSLEAQCNCAAEKRQA
jgi:hypothetical protein